MQAGRALAPLARLALDLAPDLLRVMDRSRAEKPETLAVPVARNTTDRRALTSAVHLSEVDLDLRIPLVRRVTVRKATAWTTDWPVDPAPERPNRPRRRLAGVVGLGSAVALAAVGLVASRRIT
jgi:hypothetical protein